jgi:hypothetical protein
MRDRRSSKLHFQERYTALLRGEAKRFEALRAGNLSKDATLAFRIDLTKRFFEMLYCQYSMGSSVGEMQQTLERIVDYHARGFLSLRRSYEKSINIISMAYCIGMDGQMWAPFISEIAENGEFDRLMGNVAVGMGIDIEIPVSTKYDIPYAQLVRAFDASPSQHVDIVKEYLTRHWYKGHYDSYWYGNHKDKGLYFGYWSFESAAVVKILGLNPDDFNGVDYFPIDILQNGASVV